MKYSKIILTGVIGIALAGLGIMKFGNYSVLADSKSSPSANSSSVLQVEPNSLHRGNWNLTVTGVKFFEGSLDPSKKAAMVEMTIENTAGHDKAFLPNGYLAALVGTSGKVYKANLKDSLDQKYNNSQKSLQLWAKDHNQTYYPGEFKLNESLVIDSNEENFTKVIYQNNNGQQIEFPIQGITPEIVKHNPDAK